MIDWFIGVYLMNTFVWYIFGFVEELIFMWRFILVPSFTCTICTLSCDFSIKCLIDTIITSFCIYSSSELLYDNIPYDDFNFVETDYVKWSESTFNLFNSTKVYYYIRFLFHNFQVPDLHTFYIQKDHTHYSHTDDTHTGNARWMHNSPCTHDEKTCTYVTLRINEKWMIIIRLH